MRSEGAANRWSLNSRGGGSVTGVWEHAENSRQNPSTAKYFTRQMMRPAVSAVKQLLRVVVQRENHWRSHFGMPNPGAKMGIRCARVLDAVAVEHARTRGQRRHIALR